MRAPGGRVCSCQLENSRGVCDEDVQCVLFGSVRGGSTVDVNGVGP